MASQPLLARLIPLRFRKSVPVINHIRLQGAIGMGTPLRPPILAREVHELLERAFARKGIAGVALSINSPGGSAVQSAIIHSRIRALADKNKLPVYVFCEDVAASGGYWLACAGDEIYADESSIIGSIGVIAAGFGFVEAISKLGVERRVHTAGEAKAILDPFLPEKRKDVEHLKSLQADVHSAFKALVNSRRKGKLKAEEKDLFSGAFWSGRQALEKGLIDGIGHLHDVLQAKFGEKLLINTVAPRQGWGLKRLSLTSGVSDAFIEAVETRALWSRYGL